MKLRIFLVCVLIGTLSILLINQSIAAETGDKTMRLQKYSDAVGEFGFALFRNLHKSISSDNIFLSPASIELALTMIMNGAKGDTLEAMRKTLGLAQISEKEMNEAIQNLVLAKLPRDSGIQLDIANSLWYDKDVKLLSGFTKKNSALNAEVKKLDFGKPEAVRSVNAWINKKTQSMIPSIIDSITKDMILLAVNAIYFNGKWANTFDSRMNQQKPFTQGNGVKSNVTMMRQSDTYRYASDNTLAIAEIPYGNKRYSMYIILPNAGVPLNNILQGMDWTKFKTLLAALKERKGIVEIPIFKTSFGTINLIPALSQLGMGAAFGTNADLSGISGAKNLNIGLVLHKAVISVDEQGTKAAAVTMGAVRTSAVLSEPPPFIFTADRPFAYCIVDNTSLMPLFMGKLEKPE
ncbi:MAG: serpin family protein [Spirochaetota bacterium]|nr:serpin family protein [Spirochaetota bacterium]